MDAALGLCCHCLVFIIGIASIRTVPPDACFANFRWDDCGQPPQPVMYYWKPGSRCEVGMWRGCLPNPNMFQDEYECINTCIFVARARPEDFHSQNDQEEMYPEDIPIESTPDFGNTTDVDGTQATNVTESLGGGDNTDATVGEDNTEATVGEDNTDATVGEDNTDATVGADNTDATVGGGEAATGDGAATDAAEGENTESETTNEVENK